MKTKNKKSKPKQFTTKPFVVINPTSGGGLARRQWPSVLSELESIFGDIGYEETTFSGHGEILAKEAADHGYDPVIAYGGDGTIHEVVNGIWKSKKNPALGILSAGTGGDFIKSLGWHRGSSDIRRQINFLRDGSKKSIDLGQLTYIEKGKNITKVFVNIVDAGIGAETVKRVHSSAKIFGRSLAYLTASIHSYLVWKPQPIRIRTDTADMTPIKGSPLAVIVANGAYFGGGMPIASGAKLDDGFLDVIVIEEAPLYMVPVIISFLYAGKLDKLSFVKRRRARKIILEDSGDNKPQGLDIDGEAKGHLPVTFEILPKALKVISS